MALSRATFLGRARSATDTSPRGRSAVEDQLLSILQAKTSKSEMNIEYSQRRASSNSYMSNSYMHPANQAQSLRAAPYLAPGQQMMQGDNLGNMSQGLSAIHLQGGYGSFNKRSNGQLSMSSDYHASALVPGQPGMYPYTTAGSTMLYPATHIPAGAHGNYPHLNHFGNNAQYAANYAAHGTEPHAAQGWSNRVPSDGSTIPSLITPRRGSISSLEEPVPGTPMHYSAYNNGVSIVDRSPSAAFTPSNTTPSSAHFLGPQYAKPYSSPPIPVQLQMLLKKEPAIPLAIPAPNSPAKPLDRCLENKMGETNVYIRGLLPETTDSLLEEWGSRFGDVASSKSIIDHKNNLCKGFGFIKYHNFEDAENCIRAFHHLGYEVSFARESFYSKLKKFSDEQNTNLYVSNIPRNFNEHELSSVFEPYTVCSARILRDDRGNGRGVGFARFETRDVCEEIIENFNNTVVKKPGGEDHVIQIRYSDTHEQKLLKQQTAAARQFRAQEFEFGCAQALRTGVLPLQAAERLQATINTNNALGGNDFETYLQQSAASGLHAPHVYNAARRGPGSTLPTIRSDGSFVVENHSSVTIGKPPAVGEQSEDSKTSVSTPGSAAQTIVKTSPTKFTTT